MNTAERAAFQEGAGGFLTAGDLLIAIQGIGVTAALTYVSWLCICAYQDYGKGKIKSIDMITIWFRAVFILVIFIAIIVN